VKALDLTDEERDALIRLLRDGIDRDRFPLSPRLAPIRAILDKLDPAAAPQAAARAQNDHSTAGLAEGAMALKSRPYI